MRMKTELTGVQKNANLHRLSRLIAYAANDELRQIAVDVEQYTDLLVEALEAAEKRNAELESDCWTYESTVKNLLERAEAAEAACAEAARILNSGERMALTRAVHVLLTGVAAEGK